MKKTFVFSLIVLSLFSIPLFSQEQRKILYLKFTHSNIPQGYKFLSVSLPNSIRNVLSKENFKSVKKQGNPIKDIYNRDKILNTGKEHNVDLLLTGKYYLTGTGINRKINLIIFVYDVKGGERVIEKLVIGGTGAAMFELVDSVGQIVEKEVNEYYKKREKILAIARKKREEREARESEERRREFEEKLKNNAVRTLYNSSMFLDSHVAPVKSLKVFYYMLINSDRTQASGDAVFNQDRKVTGLLSQLNLATGIIDNLEFNISIPMQFKSYISVSASQNIDGDYSMGFKFYNPIFGFKYRILKNEKQGLNLSFEFSMQFALSSKNNLFGDIFVQPLMAGNYHYSLPQHRFIFGLYLDKTIGIFTPFLSCKLSVKRYLDKLVTFGYISEFESEETAEWDNKNGIDLKITVGTEIRPAYWLIIQPYYYFYYVSKLSGKFYTNVWTYFSFSSYSIHTIGVNFIFKLSKDFSLSAAFNYNIRSDINLNLYSKIIENKTKYSFTIYFYAAALINF